MGLIFPAKTQPEPRLGYPGISILAVSYLPVTKHRLLCVNPSGKKDFEVCCRFWVHINGWLLPQVPDYVYVCLHTRSKLVISHACEPIPRVLAQAFQNGLCAASTSSRIRLQTLQHLPI